MNVGDAPRLLASADTAAHGPKRLKRRTSEKQELARVIRLIKQCGDDLTLLLLRGHLLIEERLFEIIVKRTRNREMLEAGQLTFKQKCRMAKSCFEESCEFINPQDFFKMANKLNDVRNRVAHRAEVPDLEALICKFCEQVRTLSGQTPVPATVPAQLRSAITWMYGCSFQ